MEENRDQDFNNENGIESPKEAITPDADQTLEQELDKAREESRQNYDRYVRTLAEIENLRKRTTREREEYIKFAPVPLIKKILPIIDDLERALTMSTSQQDYASLHKGVEMIVKSMHEIIKTEGVQAIDAAGKPFDPEFHEPLVLEESSEHPSNTVIDELQKGYIMHGRVLRPSLVKVSS
ncbi:MAG TPA: nucleotide exchange factor GrpE [Syntrophomonadaceae bacterium]|nr:nucleotide exchange factor GrpE [Syntrophomonadaceae bacterium]